MYIDDIFVTWNDEPSIHWFIDALHKEFATKDLGDLSYFLGIEVVRTQTGLFLSQTKYALYILTRAGMLNSRPVATPLSTNDTLTSRGDAYRYPKY